jgi:hypothetical protein
VIANVSAIERLWSIAKAVRARAKDAPQPTAAETAELAASRRTSGIES